MKNLIQNVSVAVALVLMVVVTSIIVERYYAARTKQDAEQNKIEDITKAF